MNEYFYESLARERIEAIERQAEQSRLVSCGRESRPSRLRQWRQRLHLARKQEQRRRVVTYGADQAN